VDRGQEMLSILHLVSSRVDERAAMGAIHAWSDALAESRPLLAALGKFDSICLYSFNLKAMAAVMGYEIPTDA
jgi:hypothetical protein